MVELIHGDITSHVISAAFEVGNYLGTGFLEKVYENALRVELELRGLTIEAQKIVLVHYKGFEVGRYQIDLLVNGKVLVEVKSTESIIPIFRAQIINYL